MKKLIYSFVLATILKVSVAATYYVSTTGLSTNPGTMAQPWSFTFAAATATAGDIVYVKAGNYGNIGVSFLNSGTATKKIQFIGYENVIGDLDSTDMPISVSSYTNTNYTLKFPTLTGASRNTGGGMDLIGKAHIVLRNFHITNYSMGLDAYGSNKVELHCIIASEFGDINNSYNGSGISCGSSDSLLLTNSFVLNSAAEAYRITGTYSKVRHCKAFCNEGTSYAPTDYYFNCGNKFNVIEDCYAENLVVNSSHGGHQFFIGAGGYWSPTVATDNIYRRCTSRNGYLTFECRTTGTQNNLFEDCKSITDQPGFFSYGIYIDGGINNTFNRMEIVVTGSNSLGSCVSFRGFDTVGTGFISGTHNGFISSGKKNKFTNCLFKNNRHSALYFLEWAGAPYQSVDSNSFVNCTFVNTDTLNNDRKFVSAGRKNKGNKFTNCIIYGYDYYAVAPTFNEPANFEFEKCQFFKNGFNTATISAVGSTVTNCFLTNPQFVNPLAADFHLQNTSPCINTGKTVTLVDDFDKNPRPCGGAYDIGAYEFQSCGVGINEFTNMNADLILYPNPAKYDLHLQADETIRYCIVYSMDGKKILEVELNATKLELNISSLDAGFYLLEIEVGGKKRVQKFIKE